MISNSMTGMRKTSLTLAVVAAICGTCALGASAAPSATSGGNPFATVDTPTVLKRGDAVIGALPMTQPISISVGLKLRNKDVLDAFVANNAKNQLQGLAPKLMSREQFLADHAPTQAQVQKVVNYLTSMGYKNVAVVPTRMLVTADGTALTARNAFMTSFAQVRTQDGRIAFATTDNVRVPTALGDTVQAVMGLENVHLSHTFAKVLPAGKVHTNAAHTNAATIEGVNPTWFTSIYNTYGSDGARNTNVGIVAEGSLTQVIKDLEATYGVKRTIPTNVVYTDCTVTTCTDTANSIEFELDSQAIAGVTGQALTANNQLAKITFYDVKNLTNKDLSDDYTAIVAANAVKIVNVSLGICETDVEGSTATYDDGEFESGTAQGQTFSVSTGDSGADECGNGGTTPSYPASSPYVVAVAGTTLTVNDAGGGTGSGPGGQPSYDGEVVWNELAINEGATGGSESKFEPKPSWQTLYTGSFRGVVDVAFDGDPQSGAILEINCNPTCSSEQVGGTSLAAPLFSGIWATTLSVNGNGLGFAAPILYGLPATDFHDITSGNNDGETAGVGYDLASGRGSIIYGSAFLSDTASLGNKPPVANFTASTSGLVATFTDSSTDSDGTVASHSWEFGDGATSTATNPSHTYATAGTYSVRETVVDNLGSGNGKVISLPVGPAQLLANTGFETGTATPWNMTAGVLQNNSSLAHGGNWFAEIGNGGTGAHTDHVTQTVTIPSTKSAATLTFYLHTTTTETTTTKTPDILYVRIYNASGTLLATPATYSNLNATSGYVQETVDMTPYIGQKVQIDFVGVNNATLETTWDLDDVTLNTP